MGKGQERKRDIFGGVEAEIVAHVGHVGTKVGVREHHALRLAGGAGGVDEGGKLAGQNLRSAQAVGRNLRGSSAGNECFVAQAFAGKIRAGVGHDNVLEFGKMGAHGKQLLELRFARNENYSRAAMFQDVRHAVGRFVEIDWDVNRARTRDGKVSGVPFGAVRGEQADAIARLYAQLHKCGRKACYATEKFLRGDGFPPAVAAHHLRARVRQVFHGVQEA